MIVCVVRRTCDVGANHLSVRPQLKVASIGRLPSLCCSDEYSKVAIGELFAIEGLLALTERKAAIPANQSGIVKREEEAERVPRSGQQDPAGGWGASDVKSDVTELGRHGSGLCKGGGGRDGPATTNNSIGIGRA